MHCDFLFYCVLYRMAITHIKINILCNLRHIKLMKFSIYHNYIKYKNQFFSLVINLQQLHIKCEVDISVGGRNIDLFVLLRFSSFALHFLRSFKIYVLGLTNSSCTLNLISKSVVKIFIFLCFARTLWLCGGIVLQLFHLVLSPH